MSRSSFNALLVEFGPNCELTKSVIASNTSSFKKDVRKLLRKLTEDPSAERQLKLDEACSDSAFFIKASTNSNLLFFSENFAERLPWESVNYLALEVERRKLNTTEVSDEPSEHNSTTQMTDILEKLSRIENAIQSSGEKLSKPVQKEVKPQLPSKQPTPKVTSELRNIIPTKPSPQKVLVQPISKLAVTLQQPPQEKSADKSHKQLSTPKLFLDHFDRIIDLVVAGLDDYSSERLNTSSDYTIEPPKKNVNEVTVHEFEAFKNALMLSESPLSKKRKGEAEKRDSFLTKNSGSLNSISQGIVFEDSCGDVSFVSPVKKSRKSKHHQLSVTGSCPLSDQSINEVGDSFYSVSSSKKHRKHRHHHHYDENSIQ